MKSNLNLSVVVFLALLVGCKYESIVPAQPLVESTNCSTDTVYFVQQVAPLLNSACATAGCHDAISHKDDVQMTDHYSIIQEVKIGNPEDSKLYKSITDNDPNDRMPQAPASPLTTAQIDLIYKWIKQGAKNNSCEDKSTCDTSNVTYKAVIEPMIATYCKGCHNPNNLSGGIDVSTWAKLQPTVKSGAFLGSILHNGGYSPMPKGGNMLSTCNINKIKSWLNKGALNN